MRVRQKLHIQLHRFLLLLFYSDFFHYASTKSLFVEQRERAKVRSSPSIYGSGEVAVHSSSVTAQSLSFRELGLAVDVNDEEITRGPFTPNGEKSKSSSTRSVSKSTNDTEENFDHKQKIQNFKTSPLSRVNTKSPEYTVNDSDGTKLQQNNATSHNQSTDSMNNDHDFALSNSERTITNIALKDMPNLNYNAGVIPEYLTTSTSSTLLDKARSPQKVVIREDNYSSNETKAVPAVHINKPTHEFPRSNKDFFIAEVGLSMRNNGLNNNKSFDDNEFKKSSRNNQQGILNRNDEDVDTAEGQDNKNFADDPLFQRRYWNAEAIFRKKKENAFSDLEAMVAEDEVEGREPIDTLNPVHVLQQWENLEESFRESVDAVVRQALPLLIRASSEIQLTDGCYTSFFQLLLGLRRLRPWAFQMIDAFGKPPAGMLQGTVTSFGAYDECVNIIATSDHKQKRTNTARQYFRGKYCTVEIKPPLPPKPQYYTMHQPVSVLANFSSGDDNVIRQAARQAHAFYFLTYRMDVCVPSTCTQDDVNNMAQLASKYIDIEVAVPRCSVKESLDLDDSQIVILSVVAVLSALVLFGTLLDTLQEIFPSSKGMRCCFKNLGIRILQYFSLNKNARLLFNTKTSHNGLDCLRGMRFFGMAWLVLGHTYFNSNAQMYGNLTEASAFAEGFLFQVIVNSTVSIDTFFFISGVLLAYFTLQYVNKEGIYSIPRLLVRQYVRILPSYMLVIGATFILPHFGSGPFWNETVDPVVESCRRNWWTNLLFINNFITTPEQRCLEHSWYLSCDFQLFIVALFVLLSVIKRPLLGMALNFFLALASVILTGMLTYYYKVPPTLLASFPDPQERKFLNHVVISKPYCHLGPYCVGLATGYLFYNCREIKLKACHHILGWGSSLAVTAAVVYGVLEWNKGNLPSTAVAVAYAATHRTAWALGLSWIAVICVSGHGGIINRILSWKLFIPLSRLTHIVYLVHPLIQYILTGYIRERLQTNHIIMAYFFFGHIMTSYALSAICFFLFDGPVSAVMRVLCGDFSAPAPRLSLKSSNSSNFTKTSSNQKKKKIEGI